MTDWPLFVKILILIAVIGWSMWLSEMMYLIRQLMQIKVAMIKIDYQSRTGRPFNG